MEVSQVIFTSNQINGDYMTKTLLLNGLNITLFPTLYFGEVCMKNNIIKESRKSSSSEILQIFYLTFVANQELNSVNNVFDNYNIPWMEF